MTQPQTNANILTSSTVSIQDGVSPKDLRHFRPSGSLSQWLNSPTSKPGVHHVSFTLPLLPTEHLAALCQALSDTGINIIQLQYCRTSWSSVPEAGCFLSLSLVVPSTSSVDLTALIQAYLPVQPVEGGLLS